MTEKIVCENCGKTFESMYFNLPDMIFVRPKKCAECSRLALADRQSKEFSDFKQKQIQVQNEMFYQNCRISKEFWDKDLDNFEAKTDSQKEALQAAKEMVSGEIQKLILLGKNGVGKSHLVNGVLKKVGGVKYSAYEFFAKYRECYSPLAKMTETEFVEKLKKNKLVVIDELGRTKGSEAEINFLSWVIDELHTNGNLIAFTSNKIRKKDCVEYKKNPEACKSCTMNLCIERYLGNDSISRLSSKSKIITVQGEDMRRVY